MKKDSHTQHDTSSSSRPIQRYVVPRPLLHDKWRKGKDGFLVTDAWGAEIGSMVLMTPKVWLRHAEECMHLLVHQYKNLTIILLISIGSSVCGEEGISLVKQQILEIASLQIMKVEKKLSKEWGGINANHVRGYRYLLLDNDTNTSRASPPGKVTTLSKILVPCSCRLSLQPRISLPSWLSYKSVFLIFTIQKLPPMAMAIAFLLASYNVAHPSLLDCPRKVYCLSSFPSPIGSLLALSKLRGQVDLEKTRARWDEPEHDKDLEVCIRANTNAWVIARLTRAKEVYMALEKAGETLLYASDAVMKFSDRYCDGAFSLD